MLPTYTKWSVTDALWMDPAAGTIWLPPTLEVNGNVNNSVGRSSISPEERFRLYDEPSVAFGAVTLSIVSALAVDEPVTQKGPDSISNSVGDENTLHGTSTISSASRHAAITLRRDSFIPSIATDFRRNAACINRFRPRDSPSECPARGASPRHTADAMVIGGRT